jgi:single-strand DNA-binding protein
VNEIEVTVVGNVASDVSHKETEGGPPVAWFRLASSTRYYDRRREQWADGDTSWFTVYCRRELADHVASSVAKGEPVVVTGRVRIREWERDGRKGTTVGIEARTVGHDLCRGTSAFQRRSRGPAAATDVFDEIVATADSPASGVGAETAA